MSDDIEAAIERSSLGSAEAKAARESVPPEVGRHLVDMARIYEQGRREGAEQVTAAIAAVLDDLDGYPMVVGGLAEQVLFAEHIRATLTDPEAALARVRAEAAAEALREAADNIDLPELIGDAYDVEVQPEAVVAKWLRKRADSIEAET